MIPAMTSSSDTILAALTGSLKYAMPAMTMSAAPAPAQIAYATPTSSRLVASARNATLSRYMTMVAMVGNGRVNPCDVDFKSALAVGNAREKSLAELWRSESYERLRALHLAKQRAKAFPCNRCTVI